MQFTTLLAATLTLLAAPTAVLGWAQDGRGVWVAHNTVYGRVGSFNNVHESCTRMNSQDVYTDRRDCAYWTNNKGGMRYGHCLKRPNSVECAHGCAQWDTCNNSNEDGSCSWGPTACREKQGCSGTAGGTDCWNIVCSTKC